MKKTANGTFQPRNSIEKVIPHLIEVGQKLLQVVEEIERAKENISLAEKRTRAHKKLLRELRSDAKRMVTKNYVESEVETADVMATRTEK